jgi:DNA repair photolyase
MHDSDEDPVPFPAPPQRPSRGRGTAARPDSRYLAWQREADPAAQRAAALAQRGDESPADETSSDEEPALPPLRTEILREVPKSMLAENASPDVPFRLSINPYRGCEHGCIYCYARPSHARLGLSPGIDFETRIVHKEDAAEVLARNLAKPGYRCEPIAFGVNTDAWQPLERHLKSSRALLEVCLRFGQPLTPITKSALILRDLDLLREMAERQLVSVMVSLTSLDTVLLQKLEPRAAAPHKRLDVIRQLNAAGVPVGVMVAPLIPALTDAEFERILAAAREAGAQHASYALLRLPHEVGLLFDEWLTVHAPEKAERLKSLLYELRGGDATGGKDSSFGTRMSGVGAYADLLAQRFRMATRRLGYAAQGPQVDCSTFRVPPEYQPKARAARCAAAPPDQLSLFE